MEKQSCLKCKNFFNVNLFMKPSVQSWPTSVTRCLLYKDLNFMLGHEENNYECECSRFEPTTPKEK